MKILLLNPRKRVLAGFVDQLKSEGFSENVDVDVFAGGIIKDNIFGKRKALIVLIGNIFSYMGKFVMGKRLSYDTVVLNGMLTAFPYLLLAKVFARMIPKKYVIIFFYIHGLGSKRAVKRILRFMLNDSRITMLVQNPEEIQYYQKLAEKMDVRYFPYCQDEIETSRHEGEGGKYIFAGGYTNRDYDCLIEAAAAVNARFILVGSRFNRIETSLPNVKVYNDLDADIFYSYLKNSQIVVLPLKEGPGSSGQMVALAAMSFGKPVVYAEVASVAQYFEDGISGVAYAAQNACDLAGKLSGLLEEPQRCAEIGHHALERYRSRFKLAKYYSFLSGLILNTAPTVK